MWSMRPCFFIIAFRMSSRRLVDGCILGFLFGQVVEFMLRGPYHERGWACQNGRETWVNVLIINTAK